ncbi:pilus assembly protein TadG-related protein [Nocardioides xinjiangensis]|uniref:pilus assembly protein TadG-related protein n=1 Tax=Nocardioides xinjiangensis TaxID=2817376 RepID=UPI001B308587|nr:pilus assembly protein TadG-related protein [Nocardioides sp. SYSU D00514]
MIVGLVAVVMVGLSGFVADVGLAYANKRAAQTGADAAVLGAAGVFAAQPYRQCEQIRSNGNTAAQSEANSKVAANDTTSAPAALAGGAVTTSCENGDLVVRASVVADSPNFFGGVLGFTADYDLERSATAVVEAATTGPRLRPMALCSSDIPPNAAPGTPFKLYAPGDAPGWTSTSCPMPDNTGAGNWWTLDCPNENTTDGNGTSALADQIRNGCSSSIAIVPGQGTKTGNDLNAHLAAACPGPSTTAPFMCLSGDPGQPDPGNVPQAWKDLINSGVTVPIPVFCTSPGLCAYSSITGTGTNAVFPVHKLLGVQVCGFHFGKQNKSKYPTASQPLPSTLTTCSEAASMLEGIKSDNSDTTYLVLIARNMNVSIVTADSGCALGDDRCDGGLRQVRLSQ